MWDLAKKIKRAMRRRGEKLIDLTGPQVQEFISFWKAMYQTPEPPILDKIQTQGPPPEKERILRTIQDMPKNKAPRPDGITAELIAAGGLPAKEMTVQLIQEIW